MTRSSSAAKEVSARSRIETEDVDMEEPEPAVRRSTRKRKAVNPEVPVAPNTGRKRGKAAATVIETSRRRTRSEMQAQGNDDALKDPKKRKGGEEAIAKRPLGLRRSPRTASMLESRPRVKEPAFLNESREEASDESYQKPAPTPRLLTERTTSAKAAAAPVRRTTRSSFRNKLDEAAVEEPAAEIVEPEAEPVVAAEPVAAVEQEKFPPVYPSGHKELVHLVDVGYYLTYVALAFGVSFIAASPTVCASANGLINSFAALVGLNVPVFPCESIVPWAWALINVGVLSLGASAAQTMYENEGPFDQKVSVLTSNFTRLVFGIVSLVVIFTLPFYPEYASVTETNNAILLITLSYTLTELFVFHPYVSNFLLLRSVTLVLGTVASLAVIYSPASIPAQIAPFFNAEFAAHFSDGLTGLLAVEVINLLGGFAGYHGLYHEENILFVLTRVAGIAVLVFFPKQFFDASVLPAIAATFIMVADFFLLVVDAYTAHTAKLLAASTQ